LIGDTESSGVTAKIIDCLIDGIKIFYDRNIEVDFLFDKGFDLIKGLTETQTGVTANG
jgi:hypothetical protein